MLNFKTFDLAFCEENEEISLSVAKEIAQFLSAEDSKAIPREVAQAFHNLHLSYVNVANQLRYWRKFIDLYQTSNAA